MKTAFIMLMLSASLSFVCSCRADSDWESNRKDTDEILSSLKEYYGRAADTAKYPPRKDYDYWRN